MPTTNYEEGKRMDQAFTNTIGMRVDAHITRYVRDGRPNVHR